MDGTLRAQPKCNISVKKLYMFWFSILVEVNQETSFVKDTEFVNTLLSYLPGMMANMSLVLLNNNNI